MRTALGDVLTYDYVPQENDVAPTEHVYFEGYRRQDGKAGIRNEIWIIPTAVSYTHLDVYKRQAEGCAVNGIFCSHSGRGDDGILDVYKRQNLRYAVEYGDRLLMMHQGRAVVDKEAGEKQALCIDDILEKFNEISIECGN